MGLLYDLKQKECDDDIDWRVLDDYIEFKQLLICIAEFTKDTPHIVANFLYDNKEILNLTAYNFDIEYDGNKAVAYTISQDETKIYYEYEPINDDYKECNVGYIEFFLKSFLDCEYIQEFGRDLDYDEVCYFKKTDILTLNCLKKIGFSDISFLKEVDEVENLRKEIKDKDEIIEKLNNSLSSMFQKTTTDTATLQTQLDQANERIAELEQQLAQQSENATPAIVELPHTNTALTALFDVINTHWQNPNQPPKQEFIKKWIVEKYPSLGPSKALWIDKIIRHQDQK